MKKLNVKEIEKERWSNQEHKERRKEIIRQGIASTIDSNRNGTRKVTVIEPTRQSDIQNQNRRIRVAAYCRVSTAEEAQTNSFEMQVHHFNRIISENPNYHLVKIYKDEGISVTSIRNRTGFKSMMEDSRNGKIDLILTKSISRFGRNIVDVLTSLRELANLSPPVSVFFETEGIGTIAKNLLGYYRDYTGQVKIEKSEAEIVRYIYDSFLAGNTYDAIAADLTQLGILSPSQREKWSPSTIKNILTNEKYCGNVTFQKTYTKDFRTHQQAKNDGVLTQWRWEDIIPAIISHDKWNYIQRLIKDDSLRPKKKPFRPQNHYQ